MINNEAADSRSQLHIGYLLPNCLPLANELQFKPFAFLLVRDGEFVAAFGTTAGQHLATIGRRHPLAEAVLVFPLPVRWLIRSFHDICVLKPLFSNEFAKIAEWT